MFFRPVEVAGPGAGTRASTAFLAATGGLGPLAANDPVIAVEPQS
ncbi:hypothetical protein [Amycolatopsis arida]|nr:hypothetical protein [Amycolatopsis arida]